MTNPAHDTLRRTMLLFGGDVRLQKVLATGPLAYWRLAEGSGLVIRDSAPGGLYPGAYTGITWDAPPTLSPYGKPTPFFDGANDYGNVYSAAFGAAFNLDEGAALLWLKLANAGMWTDGVQRDILHFLRDGSNEIHVFKTTSNNSIQLRRTGAGTVKSVTGSSFTEAGFLSVMLSWSVAADAVKAYKNAVQIGVTQTGNIAATGSGLASTGTLLGAANTTPVQVWNGYEAEVVVWTKPADAAMIALGAP